MPKTIEPTVERSETGFNVNYGDVLTVGVHSDQASSEAEAIKVAQPQYEEFLENEKKMREQKG